MACFYPIHGWRSRSSNPSGKRSIVFTRSSGHVDRAVTIACGQCIGCRLERSRQWALRLMHEAALHLDNCFITLTYADENVPIGGTLVKQDFQKFMKRLRKKTPERIRYYMCGEYGDTFGRPHYHAILFGKTFNDLVELKRIDGAPLYTSKSLADTWGKGHVTVGDVTFESAAYVAKYCLKKVTGEAAHEHYERCDPLTGEIYNVEPEYSTMSRRPGIAHEWFDKFKSDCYPSDFVISRNRKMRPPRYYEKLLEETDRKMYNALKLRRREEQQANKWNETTQRLRTREKVAIARQNLNQRGE